MRWQLWLDLSETQRDVIREFGWEYFEKAVWRQGQHGEFPAHFQAQVMAAALSLDRLLPRGGVEVMGHLAKAVDARKRTMAFEI